MSSTTPRKRKRIRKRKKKRSNKEQDRNIKRSVNFNGNKKENGNINDDDDLIKSNQNEMDKFLSSKGGNDDNLINYASKMMQTPNTTSSHQSQAANFTHQSNEIS